MNKHNLTQPAQSKSSYRRALFINIELFEAAIENTKCKAFNRGSNFNRTVHKLHRQRGVRARASKQATSALQLYDLCLIANDSSLALTWTGRLYETIFSKYTKNVNHIYTSGRAIVMYARITFYQCLAKINLN